MNYKKKLEHLFRSEEAIGIYAKDHNTGLRKEEFKQKHPDKEFEDVYYLPNGKAFFICTNSAQYVVDTLGEGRVYGFYVDDNPTVTHDEILGAGGHDFAVIKNRYIVDLWISHFTGSEKQIVYDLWDEKDHQMITHIFGDLECWKLNDGAVSLEYEQMPKGFQPKLRRRVAESDLEPSM